MGLLGFTKRYWNIVKKYKGRVYLMIGGLGLAVFGSVPDIQLNGIKWFLSIQGAVCSISSLLTLLGSVETLKEAGRIEDLERENSGLQTALEVQEKSFPVIMRQIKKQLEQLAIELNFSGCDRISIYVHNDNQFLRIGRYSENPNFDKGGRPAYPDDQGCIGKAWNDDTAFVNNLPDSTTNLNDYIEKLKQDWNIGKNVSRKFVMKSRTCYGCSIKNADPPTRRIAVVIFESTKATAFEEDEIRAKLSSSVCFKNLQILVDIISFLKLSLQQANIEGY